MDIIAHDIARRTTSGFEAEALMYEPMVSDAGPIAVAADGTVSTSQGVVGRIGLVDLASSRPRPSPTRVSLEAIGKNLLIETPASGPAGIGTPASAGYGELHQALSRARTSTPWPGLPR
jgi:flagellar basal body rod protein FlgG